MSYLTSLKTAKLPTEQPLSSMLIIYTGLLRKILVAVLVALLSYGLAYLTKTSLFETTLLFTLLFIFLLLVVFLGRMRVVFANPFLRDLIAYRVSQSVQTLTGGMTLPSEKEDLVALVEDLIREDPDLEVRIRVISEKKAALATQLANLLPEEEATLAALSIRHLANRAVSLLNESPTYEASLVADYAMELLEKKEALIDELVKRIMTFYEIGDKVHLSTIISIRQVTGQIIDLKLKEIKALPKSQ